MEAVEELSQELKKGVVSLKYFEKKKILGTGGFGQVWKAVHKPTGTVCALKIIKITDDEDLKDMYVREVKILSKCSKCPFLLRLLGFSISDPFFIVTPYIKSGSLYDRVKSGKKCNLAPTNKTLIAMGVAYGLMKLHQMGIIHRDLKSPNILLDSRLLPHICDFGIARVGSTKMTRDVGTTNWMAPEQMESRKYTDKVDIYSYGCVLYEMIMQMMPFEHETEFKAASLVTNGERPSLPEDREKLICSLITKCWRHNPDERPSAKKILKKFVQKKIYFDGTDKKGINAMTSLIAKEDESMREELEEWRSKRRSSGSAHHHHHQEKEK